MLTVILLINCSVDKNDIDNWILTKDTVSINKYLDEMYTLDDSWYKMDENDKDVFRYAIQSLGRDKTYFQLIENNIKRNGPGGLPYKLTLELMVQDSLVFQDRKTLLSSFNLEVYQDLVNQIVLIHYDDYKLDLVALLKSYLNQKYELGLDIPNLNQLEGYNFSPYSDFENLGEFFKSLSDSGKKEFSDLYESIDVEQIEVLQTQFDKANELINSWEDADVQIDYIRFYVIGVFETGYSSETYEIQVYDSRSNAYNLSKRSLLKTFDTRYETRGSSSMQVVVYDPVDMTLNNGFTQEWEYFGELAEPLLTVYNEYINASKGITKYDNDLNKLKSQLRNYILQ